MEQDAFAYAFKEVYGLEADIDEIAHHGSTDQLVLLAVLAHRGVPEEQAEAGIARACDAMTVSGEFAAGTAELGAGGTEELGRLG